jgi:hypothetical protein
MRLLLQEKVNRHKWRPFLVPTKPRIKEIIGDCFQYCLGDKIKINEMGGHVARMGRGELYKGFWWGNLKERGHLEERR